MLDWVDRIAKNRFNSVKNQVGWSQDHTEFLRNQTILNNLEFQKNSQRVQHSFDLWFENWWN